MIPIIFSKEQVGPVLGWTSAIAAYGAYLIPKIFATQIKAGTPEYALYEFALYISAVLFLFRQKWRTSVNRSAEAMTLIAVMCAEIFPLIHMGRPWLFYWIVPYPNTRGPLWVNFKSPLLWDFFAISTYFCVSAAFWYIGLIPDLATVRDRSDRPKRKRIFSFFSLGWNGSARTWHRYETVYLLLAGLATPLVFSVHSIVSADFATAIVPGWHTTIFPPYFVAGAIFSGLAMVLTLMLIARKTMGLEEYITLRHIEPMCLLMLSMGCMVGLAYGTEFFMAAFSGNGYEQFVFKNRALGPFRWAYWTIDVGGKPWNSLPSDVPVAFEAMVFMGAFSSVLALFGVCRLLPGRRARMPDRRVTDDLYALVLEESDAAFDPSEVQRQLKPYHAIRVEEIM
ncbi:MAG: quinol:electron acceptor oxidoreductase subunit ActD [Pirellulales bacterium]